MPKISSLAEDILSIGWRRPFWGLGCVVVLGCLAAAFSLSSEPLVPIAKMIVGFFAVIAAVGTVAGFLFGPSSALAGRWRAKKLGRFHTVADVQALSWREFETFVADAYRQKGYRVEERGGSGGDGGIDLELYREGTVTAVQCKQWQAWQVGVSPVREFLGALTDFRLQRGIFVTSGIYTKEAIALAQRNNIELLDGNDLLRLLRSVDSPCKSELLARG